MNELATVSAGGQLALAPQGGGLRPRVAARKSDDYIAQIEARRAKTGGVALTREAKVRKMALILSDEMHGFRRLGVGMVGPIQLKLRYQGIVRNVLVEDPVTPGTPVEYDVWDDLGQAYILSGTEGEVRVTPFEGKRIPVRFFRIASRPAHPQGRPVLPPDQRGRAGPGRDQAGHPQAGGRPPAGHPAGRDHRLRHPPGPRGHPQPQHHRGRRAT